MSDYPMLISNKLHSFRNFYQQRYNILLEYWGVVGDSYVFLTWSLWLENALSCEKPTFLFFSECGYINRTFLMPFKTRYVLLNLCYKTHVNAHKTCIIPESPYLCIVFFIVLDLRLTKVGVQRNSFFYVFI